MDFVEETLKKIQDRWWLCRPCRSSGFFALRIGYFSHYFVWEVTFEAKYLLGKITLEFCWLTKRPSIFSSDTRAIGDKPSINISEALAFPVLLTFSFIHKERHPFTWATVNFSLFSNNPLSRQQLNLAFSCWQLVSHTAFLELSITFSCKKQTVVNN